MIGRVAGLAALAVALCACGGRGGIYLTIEAPVPGGGSLRVPDDVDRVSVTVASPDRTVVHLAKDYALDPSLHKFPLTLALEPGSQTGSRAFVGVELWKQDVQVGAAEAVVPIVSSQTTNVTLRITT